MSVAAALAAAGEGQRLFYVGSVGGMEERIVARESALPFRALPAAALRGRGPIQFVRGSLTMLVGTYAAWRLIRELRPAAILGTGGYVCVPLFLAARALRVPTMVYLPDVVPGLAVRLLSRIASITAVNVEDAIPHIFGRRPIRKDLRAAVGLDGFLVGSRRVLVTGYPVRSDLFGQDRSSCRRAFGLSADLPVVLVYGGSRGARSVNQAVAALLPTLLARCQIIHVCGREGDEAWLREAADRLSSELRGRYRLFPYLEAGKGGGRGPECSIEYAEARDVIRPLDLGSATPSMASAFGAADLAICRSGASTLAELPAVGLPAVLVPYPYVHQDENADYLVRRGAAVKVGDAALLGDGHPQDGPLAREVIRLLENKHECQRMAEQSRALARPDAARHLAAAISRLATRSAR
ncbi:MAG: UDP-N-acetylglucosamine--N-acetylmuramyl-(pentapeptide) pyrophosphoryl-undecaprenol N-acetylglucosamine transferase [Oscillochloris sp.]|nr:UDP-N-acetylglucosamine--N-acetylmuramyl-(pentapeptide) pyrophosphoryl-undecaprenol N-acetylglucosamine transferase [Oscillochloris sp.]